ncbi:alpha/beta hydrolase [Actinocrispum wychmicini]|uniref:Serine aminopeptidase S33 domain-containing protein n=1 Tax=Actinocrispum wychmicini TaxID=1213861 RepID=A0A4R2JV86_9PSEU|nr:alpha/beta hydrolase [Actinocrispum wychmicini]TCO60959.1 hypothetical protein EV192_103541 [Actinocrispum wychmicini]
MPVAIVAAALVALLVAGVWVGQRRFVYFPTRLSGPTPPNAQPVILRTSDGVELGAWLFPAPGPVVLVANGNAGSRADRTPLADALVAVGLSVLLFDYRGFGGNHGRPSERGLALDARAAYRFLTHDRQVPPDQVIFYGESLGSAVVTELATEYPPAGLLLRSPFVDLASVGREVFPFLPVRLMLRDRYPLAATIASVAVPTTVVLGTADVIVRPEQSRRVAEIASATLVEVPGAGHNDLVLLNGPQLVAAVQELARTAG